MSCSFFAPLRRKNFDYTTSKKQADIFFFFRGGGEGVGNGLRVGY